MIHITSCVILHLVVIFKRTLFSNLFLRTLPYKGGWMGDHVHVYFKMKTIWYLNHDWEVYRNMRYTLDFIVVSIGIIEFFQLVSILTFLVYSYICVYVWFHFKVYQFLLVSTYHTYICFSCAYYIPISLSTNLVYDDKLELLPCFNWFSFQLVSYFEPYHSFYWYFIKGEKIS